MSCGAKATLLAVIFMSNTIYGLASPFLPQFLDERHISSTWTGLIFAAYAIASSITAIFVGAIVDRCGHKLMLILGVLTMSAAIVSFAFVTRIADNTVLVAVSVLLRIF